MNKNIYFILPMVFFLVADNNETVEIDFD